MYLSHQNFFCLSFQAILNYKIYSYFYFRLISINLFIKDELIHLILFILIVASNWNFQFPVNSFNAKIV